MQLKALIFDCDGTLADSMPAHWEAWREVTRRHGLDFPEHRFYALGGVPSTEILETLSREQGIPLDPVAVAAEKEALYALKMTEVRPVSITVEVARAYHGRVPMAVASGGTRDMIPRVLEHLGILELFDAVVTSEDVERQKPAPDIFLEAARRLSVSPEHCRAYEDTDLGIRAIRAAGMQHVDIRRLIRAFEAL